MAAAAVALFVASMPASAEAATPLAPTPYMGWNPYYAGEGGASEATFETIAQSLMSSGMQAAGYKIFWLDFGWAGGARDSNGQLTVDPAKWPDGMSGFTAWLHSHGFLAGIYTDAGPSGCSSSGVGSYGHYQQDANTFAAWGFDAVKVDFCGAGQQLEPEGYAPQQLYTEFSEAIARNSSGRPMILNICNFWDPGAINKSLGLPTVANSSWDSFQWAPQLAQSWRTDTDIGFVGNIQFVNVLRNLRQDATDPEAAGPGHWDDPDYLGPALGMSDNEAQAQLSMWAMVAAPLILGNDPRNLSSGEISMLDNKSVIDVDQDSLGAQGTLVSGSGTNQQVWAKPLANGDVAVALLNSATSPSSISTTASAVGLPQASSYTLQDLWAGTSSSTTTGQITTSVPAQSVTLYRVTPVTQTDTTAMLRVSMSGADSGTVSATPGPISCPGTCSGRYTAGEQVTLTATPTGGASFVGWSGGACSGTGSCVVTIGPTGSITSVAANFAFPLQTLSVNVDGTGSVTDASGLMSCTGACSTQYWPGTNVALTATPGPGMVFAGWSGACSGTATCTVPLNDAASVTARFAPPRKLTVSVIGAGSGVVTGAGISCPGTCSASYPEGTSVTLSATPSAGSQFGAWVSGGCAAFGNSCTVTMSADTSVTVAFDSRRSGVAYVVDGRRNDVVPIDLATGTSALPIRGFHAPRQIAISPDGGTAYVVNAGNATVTPINLATNSSESEIGGFVRPGPIAITSDSRTAYVLEEGRRLVPINLATDQREPPITFSNRSGVGQHAASLALAANGRTAYIGTFNTRAGNATGTLAVVDLRSGRVKATIRGFARPAALAVAPDGRTAYVADPTHGNVTAVNLAAARVIAAPALTAPGAFPGADAAALTPDGTSLYVADARGLTAINTATRSQKPAAGPAVSSPSDLAIAPNGATAYLIGGAGGTVFPIDLATDTERPALTGLGSPSAIAIANPPPLDDSVKLARLRVRGTGVSDALTCLASTLACTTTQTLTFIEIRNKLVVLVVARWTVTIAPRHTVKVALGLGAVGRRLVSRFGSLPVVLSVAIRRGDHLDTLDARQLVIRQ